ncbi:uncharacterized protein N7477_005636 [Penicillium maclennaniae]|uniref:uncharacterized protein n=1 Tax=Penicillium maclennaniae TaxID=1343394 RepID=UPI0025416ADA|nr:uncharacterized protein N7477_005636 [Penicillium maclennaniae]KAJ5670273.1 hypothetical protein N7477_005636 [Penicillium maclennaniae]
MVLISSKTFIQAHAVLLVVVAGYLIKSPELITDSDMVFMMGEALQINFPAVTSSVQSPFAYCAIPLLGEALIDLVLLSTIPFHEALDEALPYIRPLRNGNLPAEDLQILAKLPEYITKSLTIYWNVWTTIAGFRFAAYGALSLFIYLGRGASYSSAAAVTGLSLLKHRVVFMYAFVEMMTWFWAFSTLRQERQERLTKLLEDAREG